MPATSGQEGGCQCGAIRYRLLRAPAALYACHCRDCQKQSSCAFCGECGTRLWHAGGGTREEGSTTLSMKAGTLDDTSRITPTCHLWTKRAQAWLAPVLERDFCFDAEPDREETLRAQWRDAVETQTG